MKRCERRCWSVLKRHEQVTWGCTVQLQADISKKSDDCLLTVAGTVIGQTRMI